MDDALKSRLDDHLVLAQIKMTESLAKGECEVTSNYVRHFTGSGIPSFNFFVPLNANGLTDDILADTSAFYLSRKVIYAIALDEHRLPGGETYLNERRYQALPPQPTMVLPEVPTKFQADPGFGVERIGTVASLSAFYTLIHRVFDFPLDEMRRLFPVVQLKDDAIRHYLAFYDDRPVATGTAICLGDIVSIWNMCTLDNYRRQGIASGLLHHMLCEAAESGCRHSILYSTAMGYSLYDHVGYQLYSQRRWFLPPNVE
ncbi:MAG: GNAT family N-acetyltransferase [Anaerolineae bacterium]